MKQLLQRMHDNIEKQKVAVSKMAIVDVSDEAGFDMLDGQMKLQKLAKRILNSFVEEIILYAKDRVKIKWKCRDEFKGMKKVENAKDISGE